MQKNHTFIHRFVVAVFMLVFSAQVLAEPKIQQIRSNSHQEKLQIVVDLDRATTFNAFSLANPNRIVVDVVGSPAVNYKSRLSFKDRGVSRVRTGIRSETQARVVLDLTQSYQYKVYTLNPEGKRGHRVVIEVFDKVANQPVASINDPKRFPLKNGEIVLESIQNENKATDPATAKPQIALTSTQHDTAKPNDSSAITTKPVETNTTLTVTPSSTASVAKKPVVTGRDIVVMIDPGHGGKDPGARGPSASMEKKLVLSISKKLKAKIDALPGMRAVLTRSSDKYIPLRGRLAIARKNNADLFISIHADAFTKPTASGSSVYILSTKGATSEAAKWLAQSENAVDLKYGVTISDYDKDISQVLLDIQQNATIESSYIVADKTLKELKKIGKVHKNKVERAGFVVLKSPDIPAILVETAFISNPAEEKKLQSSAYQDKLATAISKGVKRYFEEYLPHHLLLINAP